jgi:hypothetical protein
MRNRSSAEYQRAVGEMVGREVLANVSDLVDPIVAHILATDDDARFGPFDRDELYSALCPSLGDLTEDQIDELAGEQFAVELTEAIDDCGCEGPWDALSLDEKVVVLEWLRVEPDQSEVMEWWALSGWLASKLEDRGEIVFDGYWGRQSTGQAILLDGVICDIYDALHG